jgi:O-antigen ligase
MTLKDTLENRYYSSMMLFFIFFYAFINIKFHHLGDIFLGLIIVGTLPIFIIHKSKIFKNPIIIVFGLILIAQTLSWINSLIYLPEFANNAPELDRLGKLFVFFFMAYWLKGSLKNVVFLWLFFIFGFIFTIFTNVDLQYLIQHTLTDQRVDFSTKDSQFDSMLSGTSLLISSALFYITLKSSTISKNIKFLSLFTIFLLVVLSTYFVLITQSRQVWLGVLGAFIIGLIAYIKIYKIKNTKLIVGNFLIMLSVLYLFSTSEIVQNRLSQEHNSMHAIINKDRPVEMDSIGVRVNSWLDALSWIKRHPVIGLDSEAIPEVIQQSNRFSVELKKHFGHLHNFFIETLVAYGFVGLLLIFALYFFILKDIRTSSLSNSSKNFFLVFGISFLTFWLIINNFESFNSRWLGVFVHNIMFASFYTFYLSNYLGQNNNKN